MIGMLAELFGTPNEPLVPEGVELTRPCWRWPPDRWAATPGESARTYRRHCATCHGISGDGAGPTAAILGSPYPPRLPRRIFKYTSTLPGQKPLPKDLRRTLHNGIPGTAMPTFAQLSEREIGALIEYVQYLSIRGETERCLLQAVVDDDAALPIDGAEVIEDEVLPAARSWSAPQRDPSLVVVPPPRPPRDTPEQMAALIAKGRDSYLRKKAQCVKCHGRDGNGKGEETELYDDWNKRKKGETPEQTEKLAARVQTSDRAASPPRFSPGAVSRRLPARRPVPAGLYRHQGDAHACRRGRPRHSGRADPGRDMAGCLLCSIVGAEVGLGPWVFGLGAWDFGSWSGNWELGIGTWGLGLGAWVLGLGACPKRCAELLHAHWGDG